MITLPDFEKAFEYENGFYLSCDITRIGKILSHYELFKLSQELSGDIVEFGVFKGVSLARWAMFRNLFGNPFSKKIVGFDTFDKFPDTSFKPDLELQQKGFKTAGEFSISKEQLVDVLKRKRVEQNVELVEGDILKTIPEYLKTHQELKISLLNLDVDIYEPSVAILEHMYPRLVKGGILILDDYNVYAGETKAVDEYFKGQNIKIRKFPFAMTPCYIIKE